MARTKKTETEGPAKKRATVKPVVKAKTVKEKTVKAPRAAKPAAKAKTVKEKPVKTPRAAKPAAKAKSGMKPVVKKAAAPKSKIKLAIAPIGWTNDDMPELGGEITFEQCVSEMALAGFTGSEVGNKYPKDPAILNKALGLRGLTICNAWFSSFLTTKPYDEVKADFIKHRDFLYAVGARVIGAAEQGHSIQGQDKPVFDAKPSFTDEEWDRLTSGLNKLGELAAQKGMQLTYHHHMGTGVQTAAEIDRLMENTDPKLLGLLYDTGHLVFSGEDHLAILNKWIKRIRHVHLKDMRPALRKQAVKEKWSFLKAVKSGVFTVPGDGCVDFKPVFKALKKAKYSGWMVVEAEQDPAKANPLEYAIMARAYIKQKAKI